jgi:inorganic pyrophosphatase
MFFLVGLAAAQKRLPGTEGFALDKKPFNPFEVKFDDPQEVKTVLGDKKNTDPETQQHFWSVQGTKRSFWHDVPIRPFGSAPVKGMKMFNFICEIPKGTTAKMEINKEIPLNPIVQDRKNGKARYYKYMPEVGSVVNYGAIPQTWERPDKEDPRTGIGGDNDPIDVVQVDEKPCTIGEVQRVRVLGSFALIDGGETDWKVIVTNVDDPAHKDGDLDSVISAERKEQILSWFRLYKTAEGKGENTIGMDGKIFDAEETNKIVMETYKQWQDLTRKRSDKEDEMAMMMKKMKGGEL